MPYPNEHAARLRDPGQFVRIRQLWSRNGIRALGGPLKTKPAGGTVTQTLRFKSSQYTAAEARKWLKDHDYKGYTFEEASGKTAQASLLIADRLEFSAPIEWTGEIEAAGGGEPRKLRRFSMRAYSGGELHLKEFRYPVVADLTGLAIVSQKLPVLWDHAGSQLIGHTESVTIDRDRWNVAASGIISGAGPATQEVLSTADNGFPWQASIRATAQRLEFVRGGRNVSVNGRQFAGPIYVARASLLREISFTALGADVAGTSVQIAATTRGQTPGEETMTYEEWLKQQGINPDDLTEEGQKTLRASYEASQKADDPDDGGDDDPKKKDIKATAGGSTDNRDGGAGADDDALKKSREIQAAETRRVAKIRELCKSRFPEIEATAIADGWDETRTELEVIRKDRPKAPAIHAGGREITASVLEAAARLASAESEERVAKDYEEPVIEAAYRHRRIGIKGLIELACRLEGVTFPGPTATPNEIVAAGFSTAGLSGILGNAAHKSMMATYAAFPSVARQIARKLSVSDFKQYTGYRLTGPSQMEEVGETGELKFASLDEESFTYQAKTYGRMFGLTREMIINDDLGAFAEIPRMIGRGAALLVEHIFWTLVLANTGDFFGTSNGNYQAGATYALGSTGLSKAVELFRKLTDADGYPIAMEPRLLLVPPELESDADVLYTSRNIVKTGTTDAEKGDANIHSNKYQPKVTPYLSNQSYTGYSAKAYYLLADPADVACFGICYLNGSENPVVEDAPLASNILGKAWRGYIDCGVCQVDKRGGVKIKGEA